MWIASYKLPQRFYLTFFCRRAKLFGAGRGFMCRPTHDRLVTLRQTSWFSPRGECEEAGRPGPPLLFFFDVCQLNPRYVETVKKKIAEVQSSLF